MSPDATATSAADHIPSYVELPRNMAGHRVSWGVFGPNDQIGTLNFLTADRVRQAAALITEGLRISLDHPLDIPRHPLIRTRARYQHLMTSTRDGMTQDERIDGFFPQYSSQWDGLRHMRGDDRLFYNATPPAEARSIPGRLGIEFVAARGIVGRGVLLDLEEYLSASGLQFNPLERVEIGCDTLDAAARAVGVSISPGDILVIRTGFARHVREGGVCIDDAGQPISPGLEPSESVLKWLWDHRVAAVASDSLGVEAWPPTSMERFLHPRAIGLLGLTLGELFDLDSLAEACRSLGRAEFFFAAKPLAIPGGVGSPAKRPRRAVARAARGCGPQDGPAVLASLPAGTRCPQFSSSKWRLGRPPLVL